MCPIHGTCRDQFADLHRLLSANLDSGADLGASLAVFVAGVPVVDSWGGYADAARTRPWEFAFWGGSGGSWVFNDLDAGRRSPS